MSKSEVSATQRMLNVWAIILIIWSFYRATFKSDLPIWFDEFVAKPFVFLIPIYFFVTHFEKKPFLEGVGFSKKKLGFDIVFGVFFGLLFFGIALFSRTMKGAPITLFHITSPSILWASSLIMAAVMEQILSTGFVLKRLSADSKNIMRPLIISALLFFFLHIPVLFGVDKISGTSLMQMMILNTMLSLTTSTLFLLRKNIIPSIIVHAFYLLSLPLLLG